jgi:hypothetical protein
MMHATQETDMNYGQFKSNKKKVADGSKGVTGPLEGVIFEG